MPSSTDELVIEKVGKQFIVRILIPPVDPGMLKLNERRKKDIARKENRYRQLKNPEELKMNDPTAIQNIDEESLDSDLMNHFTIPDAQELAAEKLAIEAYTYNLQVKKPKSDFLLDFHILLESASRVIHFVELKQFPAPTSIAALIIPYSVNGARLDADFITKAFKDFLDSIDLDSKLHENIVGLAEEYEKRLYKRWLVNMKDLFI